MDSTAGAGGLTSDEVARRRAAGLGNDFEDPSSRSLREIVRGNVFTPFNFLLGTLLIVILAVREYRDALFGIVLVANALIGIIQEWRSKRALDRLALLNAPHATVWRDGVAIDVAISELVLGDIVELAPGDQIAVDGEVIVSKGLDVDESLLTGEAEPVGKVAGDGVLSGSFVAAGSGRMEATKVGADSYAAILSTEARRFSLVRSELRDGVSRIIKLVGWLMIPTSALLVSAQIRADEGLVEAVQGSVAGLVAMVPEGLVLLTSLAFAVGAVRLARRNVLTQELAAIEGLARVDVICLDKTGTITEGTLVLAEILDVGCPVDSDIPSSTAVLGALAAVDDHPNPSLAAIAAGAAEPPAGEWTTTELVPFSSARKWSAAAFSAQGAWVLGAPDILLAARAAPGPEEAASIEAVTKQVHERASSGRRVLLLARAPSGLAGDTLPGDLDPVAIVTLEERLRPTAPDTIRYFEDQGITVKVISGDDPVTVAAVAQRAGVAGANEGAGGGSGIDARGLPDDVSDLADVLEANAVFGRVAPHQKRQMVEALQSSGHVVAMTGDGVNDTLALKAADIGVAMGSGSAAARAVARFVVLDNDFAVFPSVVAEGRRVIANIERVANLFLTKTFYALLLAVTVGIVGIPYPFIPRQMTVVSSLTIGIPGFLLALAPNSKRAQPHFLTRVLRFALPAGVVAATATVVSYQLARTSDVPLEEARTATTITLFLVAFWVLGILARPWASWRGALLVGVGAAFVGVLTIPWLNDYFDLPLPDQGALTTAVVTGLLAAAVLEVAWQIAGWLQRNTSLNLEMAAR